MTQGAHFVSDGVWALGVLMLTLSVLYYFVFKPPLSEKQDFSPMPAKQQRRLFSGILLAMFVMTGLYITRRPFYQDYQKKFTLPLRAESLLLQTNLEKERFELEPSDGKSPMIHLEGRGFALPDTNFRVDFSLPKSGDIPVIRLELKQNGYFAELETRVKLKLPENLINSIRFTELETKSQE